MGTEKDVIMRMITTAIAVLGLAGAMAIGAPTTTKAQVYFEGPGVEFGIGPRYHRYYHYYNYDRPYVRTYRPWVEHRDFRFHHRWHDWD